MFPGLSLNIRSVCLLLRSSCFAGKGVAWEPAEVLDVMGERAFCTHDLDVLVEAVLKEARPGDTVLCMSNGAFGGIHGKLLAGLACRREAQ